MSEIAVTPMEPGHYGVEVTEGDVTTGHRVTVPDDFVTDLAVDVTDEVIVRESIGFLLDRQPAVAIQPELSLYDIARSYPDFTDELLARIGAA